MKFTTANDVINYLYSLPHLHAKSNLFYIKKILAELHNPQNKVKTVHVTGTNGKGSTSYYLSNLLKKAGQKTGLFVSPYVREFNERIQLNSQNISNKELIKIANKIEKALDQIRKKEPNFSLVIFEYETAMAFLYFAQTNCDYAVIEVGIGAKHDKTNVIVPEVSIITTVGLDHEKIIGPMIEDIAHEKSGIIKQKRPVVLGNVPSKVLPILQQKAKQEQAPVYLLGKDFEIETKERINYIFRQKKLFFNLRPNVEGYDIAIAVTAFYLLNLNLSAKKIEDAINETQIPGRYQIIKDNPLVLLDGAHNIQAIKNLLAFIRGRKKRNSKINILIAIMKDKDIAKIFSLFLPTDKVILTTISYPRAAKIKDFPQNIQKKYQYIPDYRKAFKHLLNTLNDNDILLVTGSFYLISEVLKMEK